MFNSLLYLSICKVLIPSHIILPPLVSSIVPYCVLATKHTQFMCMHDCVCVCVCVCV